MKTIMRVLIVHQNCPGQYLHLARYLGRHAAYQVVFITQHLATPVPGIKTVVYSPRRTASQTTHHYLKGTEAGILNAQEVARVALELKRSGFVPDVMLGHNGWGEIAFLKEVFPETPLIGYFEFFYHFRGADVGFDPSEKLHFDTAARIRTKNLGNLLGLDACDVGQCPTQWQKSRYPACYQPKLHVIHEGIDTARVQPNAAARLILPAQVSGLANPLQLNAGDEIVTYVARNLEPYRGFPSFMRSLPAILEARPNARVIVVGGDEVSYGRSLGNGMTYRQELLSELGHALDLSRVSFLGKVPYEVYLRILQVSCVHVYLTYPFVLSWSMLEAMAAGCLVVGSRTAPVQEVIQDQENGLLVDFFRPDHIASRVIEALFRPDQFRPLRKQARQTVIDRYDLKTIALPRQLKLVRAVAGRECPLEIQS